MPSLENASSRRQDPASPTGQAARQNAFVVSPYAFGATSRPSGGAESYVYRFLVQLYEGIGTTIEVNRSELMDAVAARRDEHKEHSFDNGEIKSAILNLTGRDGHPPMLELRGEVLVPSEGFGILKNLSKA